MGGHLSCAGAGKVCPDSRTLVELTPESPTRILSLEDAGGVVMFWSALSGQQLMV
jgi:hypothetical protein